MRGVGLYCSRRATTGLEHANGEIGTHDRHPAVGCQAGEIAGAGSEVEEVRTARKGEAIERRGAPPMVESERDESIDQLVARCDRVEHRSNGSGLRLPDWEGGLVLRRLRQFDQA